MGVAKDKPNGRHANEGALAFPVVGIGASAGGLRAAEALLKNTPVDSGMAFVLVFHLDPRHKSEAAALLQRHTRMPVAQVEGHVSIERDHVYVIPPNHGLSLIDGGLTLTARNRDDGRPTVIDHFFRSLAEHAGERAIGIVLSGTGSEGSQGLKAIKEAGGLTVVQDETEAEYGGMPHSAIATGLVDFVLPVAEIPAKLLEIRDSGIDFQMLEKERAAGENDAEILQKIFVQLRTRVSHDFSQYKQNTVLRRITRRMQVHQVQTLGDYLALLREMPTEAEALFRELLISVTNFFRDPEAMGVLEHDVMPKMCQRMEGGIVRAWVPGCATGEEAYSLAMLLGEACDGLASQPHLQIFATDVDEHALETARRGWYPEAIVGDVSEARLRRFFDREGEGFVVKGFLREMILFTRHDLLQDPPFSRLDLISCRNLLIYLKTDIQSKIFALFHFALKPQSWLFLGGSESIGASGKLFGEVDRKAKIFQSRRVPLADVQFPLLSGNLRGGARRPERDEPRRRFEEIVRDELLTRYAPPCVIVGENYDVTFISGRVGKYLEPGSGAANYNILDMARENLRLELRTALFKAFHDGEGVQGKPVRVRTSNGSEQQILLTVRPVAEAEGHMLVVFEDGGSGEIVPLPPRATGDDNVIAQLETELTSTRESLQTSIEELETSNEELRASNEELQSMNEEMQSTTEELETGKEELQSTNEELLAVNQELQARNDELARANSDLNNLITSTEIATLFLDGELRVRRYSPRMTGLFNLIASDVGRPFAHLTHNLEAENLVADAEKVLQDLTVIERELAAKDGNFYQARLRPYRSVDNKVDGVVLTFVDVSVRHKQETETQALNVALEKQKAYVDSIIATVREPMLVLDRDLRVVTASRAFYSNFGTTPDATERVLLYDLGDRQWDIRKLRRLLEEILPQRTTVEDFEVRHDFGDGVRTLLLNARRLKQQQQQQQQQQQVEPLILLAFEDITERRAAALMMQDSEARLRLVLDAAETGTFIWYPQDDRSEPDARMLELFGQPPDGELDLAGAFASVIHHDDHERFAAAIADAIDPAGDGMLDEEVRLVLPGDESRWIALRAQAQFDGEPKHAMRVPGIAWDITERKRRELDLGFLAEVGEELGRMFDADTTMARLGAKIGAHFDASAVAFGEVDDDEDAVTVTFEWKRAGVPSLLGRHRISDFHGGSFSDNCRAGETCVIRDTAADPEVDAENMAAMSVGALVSAPLLRAGQWRFQMSIFDDVPRDWRDGEIELLRELTVRIWTRLERARAERALGESEARYRTLFDSIDEAFCIMELIDDSDGKPVDFRFVETNPAFPRHLGLADPTGKTMKEIAPGLEQGWFDTYSEIAVTGEPQRFQRQSEYLQRWFDVYAFRIGGAEQRRVAVVFTDITQRKREERLLVRLASIVDSSDDAIISKNLDGVITSWNSAAEWMFGYSAGEAVGQPITDLIIPEDRLDEEADILRCIALGETLDHFETVRRRKDGSTLDVSVTISPLMVAGQIVGASKIARDISERKRTEQHRELLIHELNHRVKNTLATVQSLAMQTFKGAGVETALETFDARLFALSAAHDVLTRESWKGASIHEIVQHAVEAWTGGSTSRINLDGPELRLRPTAALALAMALHELATNATKYGALSSTQGGIEIRWSASKQSPARFRLHWREYGGPPVHPPTGHGFGTRLIEYGLAQDLGGEVMLAFNHGGVECVINAPLDDIREEEDATP